MSGNLNRQLSIDENLPSPPHRPHQNSASQSSAKRATRSRKNLSRHVPVGCPALKEKVRSADRGNKLRSQEGTMTRAEREHLSDH